MKKVTMVSFLILTLAFMVAGYSSAQTPGRSGEVIPGQFIVVLNDDVANPADVAQELSARHGLALGHVYHVALKGFSAHIPAQRLSAVQSDPRVSFVEPDGIAYAIDGQGSGKGGGGGKGQQPPQETPTGIDRIDAERSEPADIDVDIAIIDTGVCKTHPDLNFYRGYTVRGAGTGGGNDDNGHGSHVAGTAAAVDNGIGVVGVAPGARIWSVKVLNKQGYGSWSGVIAGIDYVTLHADEIDVANMSLGGTGISDALRLALQNSVAAGVFYAVAAGNDSEDVYGYDGTFGTGDDHVPAAYPEVAAVSAMADYDGKPSTDDTFASFSNFSESVVEGNPVTSPGAAIDLAAPGVNIKSTYLANGYATGSGTSMASPHVAGAAALYISVNGKPTSAAGVAAVRQALIYAGASQSGPKGFTGDPDANPEPLADAERL